MEKKNAAGKVQSASSYIEITGKAVRILSAQQACRSMHWLKTTPALNSAGNLRGQVVSRQFRIEFNSSMWVEEVAG